MSGPARRAGDPRPAQRVPLASIATGPVPQSREAADSMSARNGGKPRGRTREELERAAANVIVRDAIREYRSKSRLPAEFSYSLETRRHYEAGRPEDRLALLGHYGDGRSPVYMVAITQVRGLIADELAMHASMDCVRLGFVPFLGRWISDGVLYEDVSMAMDHGMTDRVTTGLLKNFKQEAAIKITRDRYYSLHNPEP